MLWLSLHAVVAAEVHAHQQQLQMLQQVLPSEHEAVFSRLVVEAAVVEGQGEELLLMLLLLLKTKVWKWRKRQCRLWTLPRRGSFFRGASNRSEKESKTK